MPFACNRLFRERVGAVLVYQLQSRRRFLPGTVRPKIVRRLPSKHPKIHHRPIVDESEHVSMQGQVRTNRRGQCPFPGHDLSVPQVISILRPMLARCDAHFSLLAWHCEARPTGFLRGSQECQPCTSQPVLVLDSLPHLRCAPDASRRSLTLILRDTVPLVPARPSITMF